MKDFWNERYREDAYVYGTAPNIYFKNCLQQLKPGRLLLPAEGEGRNAVFAAGAGWTVDAFDYSISAWEKARALAERAGVEIAYRVMPIEDFEPQEGTYDAIALIFAHQPPVIRQHFHRQLVRSLKGGGHLILEAFRPEQIPLSSGGPKNPELLYTKELLLDDFQELEVLELHNTTTVLDEGAYHHGAAEVIRFLGKKP